MVLNTQHHKALRSLSVGTVTLDIITSLSQESFAEFAARENASYFIIEKGCKFDAMNIEQHFGGGAFNTAVNFAKQGFKAQIFCKVGNDLAAQMGIDLLEKQGVDHKWVLKDTHLPTSSAVMISDQDSNPTIFANRSASNAIDFKEIKDAIFEGQDLVYVTNFGKDFSFTRKCLALGAKSKAKLIFNPGMRQIKYFGSKEKKLFGQLFLLACNRVEAAQLLPWLLQYTKATKAKIVGEIEPQIQLDIQGNAFSLKQYMGRLLALGMDYVLFTDGKQGAYLAKLEQGYIRFFYQPAFEIDVVGTAGAGDAFCSSIAAALISGFNEASALKLAAKNAASVVGHLNTTDGLQPFSSFSF